MRPDVEAAVEGLAPAEVTGDVPAHSRPGLGRCDVAAGFHTSGVSFTGLPEFESAADVMTFDTSGDFSIEDSARFTGPQARATRRLQLPRGQVILAR